MTPGLAIFYGGTVRTTGVLNMIMMSFISIPLVTVAWLLVGYTIAFSEDGARASAVSPSCSRRRLSGREILNRAPTVFVDASRVVYRHEWRKFIAVS
jgi:ammonia channel protein AmtB